MKDHEISNLVNNLTVNVKQLFPVVPQQLRVVISETVTKHLQTPKVKVGESWYCLRKGALTLVELTVTDITSATVELQDNGYCSKPQRYKWSDIEFVELIEST